MEGILGLWEIPEQPVSLVLPLMLSPKPWSGASLGTQVSESYTLSRGLLQVSESLWVSPEHLCNSRCP